MVARKIDEFTMKLGDQEFCDMVTEQRSARGEVYGVLRDYLTSLKTNLADKTTDVRSELDEVESERKDYAEKEKKKKELLQNNVSPENRQHCKYIL